MKKLLSIIFAISPLLLFGQKSSHNGAPKFAPEDGKQLLIMGQDLGAVGGLEDYSDGYVDNLGHYPAGVTTYAGFPGLSGLKFKANWGAGDVSAQAYVDEPNFNNTALAIGLHLVGKLKSIIAGNSDYDIDVLGNWIKEQDRPVFLRVGYEFDGSWNGYDPTYFKEAWIYIVKYFDEMDIRNVAYVWQSAGINTYNIERWYPGDEYVNWVGYSHFDGPNPGQSIRDFADGHDKPVMIAEAAPRRDLKAGSGESHWEAWFVPLFKKIYENDRIKALAYINADWESQSMWKGQGWGDSRLQVNEFIKAKWQGEIEKESWLLAGNDLFEKLQYQMWKDSVIITSNKDKVLAEELILKKEGDFLAISSTRNSAFQELHVYDLHGASLFLEQKAKHVYHIPLARVPMNRMVIIRLLKKDKLIVKKIGFID